MKPGFWNPADLRRSERLVVDLAAEIRNDWQCRCLVRALNLSQHGIAVEGRGSVLDVAFPNFNPQHRQEGTLVSVFLGLREGQSQLVSPSVQLCCRTAYVKRTAIDSFVIGLAFHSIDTESADRLERYLRGLE